VFITAVMRREGHPVEMALNLIEKTAVVSSQDEERGNRGEEGSRRYPYRYGEHMPSFIRVGNSYFNSVSGVSLCDGAFVLALLLFLLLFPMRRRGRIWCWDS